MRKGKAIRADKADFSKMGIPIGKLIKNIDKAVKDITCPESQKKELKSLREIFEEVERSVK